MWCAVHTLRALAKHQGDGFRAYTHPTLAVLARTSFDMLKKVTVSITISSGDVEAFEVDAALNGIFFEGKGRSREKDVYRYSTKIHEINLNESDQLTRHNKNIEIIHAYLQEVSGIFILANYFIEPSYLLLIYQEISRETTVTFPMKTVSLLANLRLGISEDVQCE
jgi:hypothetical protein